MKSDKPEEIERDICRQMFEQKLALKPTQDGYALGAGLVSEERVAEMKRKGLIRRHDKCKWLFVLTKNGFTLAQQEGEL
jgi:hypothetical protein